MEKELAKRLAAKAARGELADEMMPDGFAGLPEREVEPAPDSGVRNSQNSPAALGKLDDDPMRPLTYSVYTVSELDDALPVYRSAPPAPEAKPPRFRDAGNSGRALAHVLWSWARAPKPRPAIADVARVPFAAFVADLRAALATLPWKKIGWTALIATGTMIVFLFGVMTVAELTDDLKPTRTGQAASKYSQTGASKVDARSSLGASATTAATAATAAEPAPAIELDDELPAPTPAPKAAKATPRAKPKSKKPKPPDMFNP